MKLGDTTVVYPFSCRSEDGVAFWLELLVPRVVFAVAVLVKVSLIPRLIFWVI